MSAKTFAKPKKKESSGEVMLQTKGEKIFNVFNMFILAAVSIISLYPLVYVFVCSISNGAAVDAGKVLLIPKGINFRAYQEVLKNKLFWTSYANTLFYTIAGTAFSMLVSAPAAYALSKRRLVGRKTVNILVAFTMWFTPGFIPLYLNYTSLGVENNRWMIVISFGVQAFNIILLRNYFEAVPPEMDESAKIDGASDFTIFSKIYLPLSKPALATVTLYYAMSRWNGYFWSTVLLSDMDKIPLQVYIKQKIIDQSLVAEYASSIGGADFSYTTLIYALVVCAVVPVLIAFPYIQKYFTKGVMVGAVKG